MGLDQYLYHAKPDLFDPFSQGDELGYWRKDWHLQDYISTGNCESRFLDLADVEAILSDLDIIYDDTRDSYIENTKEAFTKAKQFILKGERIIYYADW